MVSPSPSSRSRLSARRGVRAAAAALAFVLLLAGCHTLDERQRMWIFQPGTRSWAGAGDIDEASDVFITHRSAEAGAEVRLHGLWLPQADARAPLLLYLHGAGWDVRSSAQRLRRMHELGFAVLGIDYRGFGKSSEGLPSERSAQEDARAAWAWMAAQRPGAARYVFGHSLGGAIAVQLAAGVSDDAGLIVEGTFPSIADVWGSWKWGWMPVRPFLTQRFDAGALIAQVGVPVLVVHGSADTVISPSLGRALYEQAASPKRFELVQGGSHHSTNSLGQPQYREALRELFGLGTGTGTGG